MKERPILFSGPMVQAIREGRKTKTRRVIKPQPNAPEFFGWCSEPADKRYGQVSFGKNCMISSWAKNPYGQPGDGLWVKETWCRFPENSRDGNGEQIYYRADQDKNHMPEVERIMSNNNVKWRPSIFMSRRVSRINLELVSVRVERVQDISEEDAYREGIEHIPSADGVGQTNFASFHDEKLHAFLNYSTAREAFKDLWDSINAKRGFGWDANPWVWVIEFKVL